MCSAAAWPPVALTQCSSTNMSFCTGSSRRDWTSNGRRCSCSAVSAMRAERFAERTAANVATASTSVPPPVTSEEIVGQSVASKGMPPVCHGPARCHTARTAMARRRHRSGSASANAVRCARPRRIASATGEPREGTTMNQYAILRRSGWRSGAELQAAAERSTRVGNEQMADEVRWIRSYVLDEGGGSVGTVCIYEATSEDAIRKHAALADLPVDEIIPIADTVVVRPDPATA